ncbi:MAG: hypothetical protein RIB58_12775 [Phycisphaerales bacterium]
MHICSTHACHASHAHAGFCADCMALHAGAVLISVPTVLIAALGVGLIAYAATKLLKAARTPAVATA